MKNCRVFNKVGLVAFAAVLTVGVSVQAADMASGLEKLAEISAKVSVAKANLAKAANKGDVMGAAEAARRSSAADSAMAEATAAFTAMERALAAGNNDAASAALQDLKAAGQKVVGALNVGAGSPEGDTRGEEPKKEDKQGKKSSDDSYDSPNIGEKLGDTSDLQGLFDDLFKDFWSATGGAGDSDATPQ